MKLSIDMLQGASRLGGATALSETGKLRPAAGAHALVSPAKYDAGGKASYVFETRFIDGRPANTVLIDSRTSTANRLEEAISQARDDGHPIYSIMPVMQVIYEQEDGETKQFTDLQLPHRAFDAHIRLGSINGELATNDSRYQEARNATQSNAWNLFEISPITCLFGAWDSTRKKNQVRFPSAIVGEIIGVLADQEANPDDLITRRSGARIDPLEASIKLPADVQKKLCFDDGEISPGIEGALKKGTANASQLVIGAIPPSMNQIDGIATSQIIRSYVLSFATLRRLHFGRGVDGDAAIRTLLAAVAINAMVRNDSELFLRANTHLVEAEPPVIRLDARMGESVEIDPMTIEEADTLLEIAYKKAEEAAGISWQGQVFEIVGNPSITKAAVADEKEQ